MLLTTRNYRWQVLFVLAVSFCLRATLLVVVSGDRCVAQDSSDSSTSSSTPALTEVLSEQQWRQVDQSVERGLAWLATQQQPDGSFPTLPTGQPAVTGLCVLAFLGHGHLPGEGPYGEQITRAVDYMVSTQKQCGLLAFVAPNGPTISRRVPHSTGQPASYNHAIAGLVLSETYAMEGARRASKMQPVIRKALDVTLEMQDWAKEREVDEGGWRYLDDHSVEDSDLSITGWQLMFLRSAKNAGFDVAQEPIDRGVGYVRRCFSPSRGLFVYKIQGRGYPSRAMAGAGILALAHAGLHHTPEAKAAGEGLLKNGFESYNRGGRSRPRRESSGRYHYGLLTCCQAMYQLGGQPWQEFFPPTARTIVDNQQPEGSWPRESHFRDRSYGNAYTTAICLIALGAPNQLLPIFQR